MELAQFDGEEEEGKARPYVGPFVMAASFGAVLLFAFLIGVMTMTTSGQYVGYDDPFVIVLLAFPLAWIGLIVYGLFVGFCMVVFNPRRSAVVQTSEQEEQV